jgi:DNA mismatch endonuclease (patch repair protein)
VFVDGDFWHGREWRRRGYTTLGEAFKQNQQYWVSKITATVQRDLEHTESLEKAGWRVFRVWESAVQQSVETVADNIQAIAFSYAPPVRL